MITHKPIKSENIFLSHTPSSTDQLSSVYRFSHLSPALPARYLLFVTCCWNYGFAWDLVVYCRWYAFLVGICVVYCSLPMLWLIMYYMHVEISREAIAVTSSTKWLRYSQSNVLYSYLDSSSSWTSGLDWHPPDHLVLRVKAQFPTETVCLHRCRVPNSLIGWRTQNV